MKTRMLDCQGPSWFFFTVIVIGSSIYRGSMKVFIINEYEAVKILNDVGGNITK